jgi:hypothetical protein
MTPFTWFGLVIRTMGVWTMVQTVQMFIYAFNLYRGFDAAKVDPLAMVNQGIGYFVVGLILIKFGPVIAGLCYPRAAKHMDVNEESGAAES